MVDQQWGLVVRWLINSGAWWSDGWSTVGLGGQMVDQQWGLLVRWLINSGAWWSDG